MTVVILANLPGAAKGLQCFAKRLDNARRSGLEMGVRRGPAAKIDPWEESQ